LTMYCRETEEIKATRPTHQYAFRCQMSRVFIINIILVCVQNATRPSGRWSKTRDLQVQRITEWPCSCSAVQPQVALTLLLPTGTGEPFRTRLLVPVVALVEDLPGQHGRLDDHADDGRRLADVALVPRERRPRWAHPVHAAQQVLVAPRVQVIICKRQHSEVSSSNKSSKTSRRDDAAATYVRRNYLHCSRTPVKCGGAG
jgi:hypothetical protein